MAVEFKTIEGTSNGYRGAVVLLALMTLAGTVATWILVKHGLYQTGLTNRIPWGIQITIGENYIGLSCGAQLISVLSSVFGKVRYKPYTRLAAFLALLFLVAGLLSVATDQGRIDRFIVEPFTHFNLQSMFSINPILYVTHGLLCLVYLWALFTEKERLTKVVAVIVVGWAFAVHTGTGMILGYIPREMHQSSLMPPTFIVAALASGTAMMLIIIVGMSRLTKRYLDDELVTWLGRVLAVFLVVVLYLLFIENTYRYYLIGSRRAAHFYLFGGWHSFLFWFGLIACGCVIPAILLFHKKTGKSVKWIIVASVLVVLGVLCERYVIVIPGQINPPHLFPGMVITSSVLDEGFVSYSMTFYEILQAVGVFGFIGLMFMVGLKVLAFAPTEARVPERDHGRNGYFQISEVGRVIK